MKLIDVKDTLPVGFIPIQETVDTRESAPRTLALGASSSRGGKGVGVGVPKTACVSLWKCVRGFPVDGEESLPLDSLCV